MLLPQEAFTGAAIQALAHRLPNFFTMRNHFRFEKRFRQFAFTSQSEFRKPLVPLALWHFWIGVQPILQFVEIGQLKFDRHETAERGAPSDEAAAS
jgi:hypothetical protein